MSTLDWKKSPFAKRWSAETPLGRIIGYFSNRGARKSWTVRYEVGGRNIAIASDWDEAKVKAEAHIAKRIAKQKTSWRAGLRLIHGFGGTIEAAEENGRRFFAASVAFPQASGWWPRSTEICALEEAQDWIEEQEAEYRAHRATQDVRP